MNVQFGNQQQLSFTELSNMANQGEIRPGQIIKRTVASGGDAYPDTYYSVQKVDGRTIKAVEIKTPEIFPIIAPAGKFARTRFEVLV